MCQIIFPNCVLLAQLPKLTTYIDDAAVAAQQLSKAFRIVLSLIFSLRLGHSLTRLMGFKALLNNNLREIP